MNSMLDCAFASAQSSIELSRLNSSDASTMTSAGFSTGLRLMPRACVSRERCESTPFNTSASCRRSCDWRSRPEAKRVNCWPIMPAWRAASTSSRSARKPRRSMRPVLVSVLMRSSAAVSGAAISAPICATRSCQRSFGVRSSPGGVCAEPFAATGVRPNPDMSMLTSLGSRPRNGDPGQVGPVDGSLRDQDVCGCHRTVLPP